jgi:hypothetical protein
MKAACIPLGLALAGALALSCCGALAASGQWHALSETEMSDVHGRGLSEPTLSALGALTTQEQGSSAVSASSDAVAALGSLTGDGLQGLDRQMAQQRLQTAATGLQATLKITQTLLTPGSALAPIASSVALPVLPFPLLFALPSLSAIQNKH